MSDLKDGDLAIIRFKDNGAECLAQFCTDRETAENWEAAGHGDWGPRDESWALFGSDLDFPVDDVEVVRRVYITAEEPA